MLNIGITPLFFFLSSMFGLIHIYTKKCNVVDTVGNTVCSLITQKGLVWKHACLVPTNPNDVGSSTLKLYFHNYG